MSLSRIGSILHNRPGSSAITKGVFASKVVESANAALARMFGTAISKYASATYYKNKTLGISCAGAVVSQELKLRQGELIHFVESALRQKAIERVAFFSSLEEEGACIS